MTDTNQASELYELCKEVYEKTGWEDVRDFYHENDTFDEETQTFKRNGIFSIVEHKRADYNTPLYTSDYLLEKLQPFKTEAKGNRGDMMPVNAFVFVRGESKNEFRAGYRYNLNGAKYSDGIYADTPLKALLKLTIALSEAGELK